MKPHTLVALQAVEATLGVLRAPGGIGVPASAVTALSRRRRPNPLTPEVPAGDR